ncbi:GNAT family N-acetyltransferase [Rhodococcus sp. BP-149]|uniref:GNAT family N-acetyltransferase n=1 Tax=unclassified Rhodococcus (in: high G+C Gram-positive bacteria) TaxID=192944 RepID=UPI001C9A7BEB|nr:MULTISPECIES: GNAT family N-acetyltransferase [unclassified Rhodococcus (in: high G+C Gram-positive bacteria)]MBY6686830.1 GNAT family N-acetyltransferase [Rhodococcus sp. BP-288]MBY6694117.1 GNAT family N-acetyltransferase [Rhodococcus sp. BP-188]MBY6698942.1 GNAT family N-acetyltransferase [Rhodococcus sp. BP-285]MBY6702550.1 GNAT family N-acetyltransferase [Rhodococcus sp. BP-283]MBY6711870.1 GNAT family N-acetyltransferase [Rhodococcus sp. BP-160]
MTIEIHSVTADDWKSWRSVRLAALAADPDVFGSTFADWQDAPEHRWRTRLSIPGALDVIAFSDAVPVGLASGVPNADDPDSAELISMWVDAAARGQGVARSLITAIAEWAVASGALRLELSVMPDNDAARRAYERMGFTASETRGHPLPDSRHEVVMRRDLAP